MQGAWAFLLSRYGGEDDVVFGAVTSGRSAPVPGIEETVGLFINTLPVRVRVRPAADWREGWRELQDQQLEMRQYEHSPLPRVQGWSEVPRGLPLFESVLAFENYPVDEAVQKQAGEGLGISRGELREQTTYPLTLAVVAAARLDLRLLYDVERFDGAAIARLPGHLEAVLAGLVERPAGGSLRELSLLTAAERHQLLVEWSATAAFPAPLCLHEIFAAQAAARPDAVAVVAAEESLTYGELAVRANRLAHRLRALGVGPDVPVGLLCERSLAMEAIVGVLKAGGAYVPLDPLVPEDRLAGILADARPPVLVVQERLLGALPATAARVLCLDAPREALWILSALAPWLARHGDRRPRLINMYGITETTVHVSYRLCSKRISRTPRAARSASPSRTCACTSSTAMATRRRRESRASCTWRDRVSAAATSASPT